MPQPIPETLAKEEKISEAGDNQGNGDPTGSIDNGNKGGTLQGEGLPPFEEVN